MSGTSLDGIDIALCQFSRSTDGVWNYEIVSAECCKYDEFWKQNLSQAHLQNGLDLMILHQKYGSFIGELINSFGKKNNSQAELIASHGHTVFHQPAKMLSFQLGAGSAIYAATGIPVVCDFRSIDICLGGQGAPLVPVGDALLFKQYDYCLNLGGIANISYDKEGHRIGYDICGCNLLLNAVANEIGLEYDDNGHLAGKGKIDNSLLNALNDWAFYRIPPPKSLDKETMLSELLPLIYSFDISAEDKLATLTEHIAAQISKAIEKPESSLLITGGGALNGFLVQKISQKINANVVVPPIELIQYKEALIFAFLGLLRALGESNTLACVTGAERDTIGGAMYGEL